MFDVFAGYLKRTSCLKESQTQKRRLYLWRRSSWGLRRGAKTWDMVTWNQSASGANTTTCFAIAKERFLKMYSIAPISVIVIFFGG
jgi:hypothetical protein